ncbi:hypothetical protein [Azospirillum sp. B510]|uniref:hypothetical protein n=1 Tax=Azospirillum sp. (strain B510) TaxID=137722 RepID=UPI0013912BE5|nr:hypothetical protein [Azospirillum sp. B510]
MPGTPCPPAPRQGFDRLALVIQAGGHHLGRVGVILRKVGQQIVAVRLAVEMVP